MAMKELKAISLFAGIGGIDLGLKQTGIKTIWANEFDKYAAQTYQENHETFLDTRDITTIPVNEIPNHNMLVAGFPCQPFSIAGKQQGFDDTRGTLFFEIIRILKSKKPEIVLLENVKNLVSHDKGNTFKVIKNNLENLGYMLKYKVLNTKTHGGLPQNRERIFIVGFLKKKHAENFTFPKPIELTLKVKDILETNTNYKYFYSEDSKIANALINSDSKKVYQWRRHYIRENKDGIAPTLTANMGLGGHNVPIIFDKYTLSDKGWAGYKKHAEKQKQKGNSFSYKIVGQSEIAPTLLANYWRFPGTILLAQERLNPRKLTPRECARLQGFPDSFKIPVSNTQAYKQFGNAVSVPVLKRIAEQILEAIQKERKIVEEQSA